MPLGSSLIGFLRGGQFHYLGLGCSWASLARLLAADGLGRSCCPCHAAVLFAFFLGADFSKISHVFADEPADRALPADFPLQSEFFPTRQMGTGGSPLEPVYAAGYREIESQTRTGNPPGRITSLNFCDGEHATCRSEEVRKAEKYMPWLATTGSVTPFIGLFGTVWGVMDAFTGLGAAGSASLRAVAPGHRGSVDHHGGGAFHRGSRRDRLQPLFA